MRTTTRIGTAALAGFLAVMAGCADPAARAGGGTTGSGTSSSAVATAASAPSSEPVGVDEFAGGTYLSTAVTGRTLVDGTTITVRFGGGELSANAGCNTVTGTYTTESSRLTVADMGTTEIGCPSALSEQDTWLAGFLGTRPSWALDGRRLTLTSGSATIELTDKRVADPDRPLAGTIWQLTGLVDRESASSVPADSPAVHLRLVDGELTLWNDCAVVIGRYAVDGKTLDATVPDPTGESSCASRVLGVAADVLGDSTTVGIEANQLRLLAPDGRGLMFTEAVDVQAPIPPTGAGPSSSGPMPTPTTGTPPDASRLLAGRTFKLTRLFTDAGGADTRKPRAWFRITFGVGSAVAESQCGTHTYSNVQVGEHESLGWRVDLGEPAGPACSLGTDPSGLPRGTLHFGSEESAGYYLTTGVVGWYFDEVTG